MLIVWSAQDPATIRKVIGPILQRTPVPHRVEPDLSKIPSTTKGDVILAMGGKLLDLLKDQQVFPKNNTLGKLRETPKVLSSGATLFVTYDPAIVGRDYARLPEIQWDAQLAVRMHQTGSTRPPIGKYTWEESLHELIEEIERRHNATGKPVPMACDIETIGLDEYAVGVRIISISFTIDEGRSYMLYFEDGETLTPPSPWKSEDDFDYWEALWNQVNWLLTSRMVATRGANFKFDRRWINHHWKIDCTNFGMDTLLVGSLLNENVSNSLKMHAKMHTEMGGYEDDMDKWEMSRLDKVPKEELGNYMGGDTDVTLRVSNVFKPMLLADKALANFYAKVLHPSSNVFEKMERNGICVDLNYYAELETQIADEQARLRHVMQDLIPKKLYAKWLDAFMDYEKNPFAKPELMRELFFSKAGFNLKPVMFTEKSKDPSTSIDHLMMFKDNVEAQEFIDKLSELNSANKTMSTYVRGFLKHLRSDGKFHPHYMLFRGAYGEDDDDSGTDTGRTSAKDPAVQTIPKHTKWAKKLRRAYIPPPGKTIIQLDFSQGELRIAACLANERTMLEAYAKGIDLHAVTAAKLVGMSLDEFFTQPEDWRDAKRSLAKAGNFGLIYGMSAEGFVEYAFTSYGVKMTLQQSKENRDAFFELYSGLDPWHKKYKDMAHRFGMVRSPLGRIRHLPLIYSRDRDIVAKAERNAVNSPVQSTLSDMMQLAMVHIDREYGSAPIEMFLMTHDSVALYVPVEDAMIWGKRLKEVLDNLPLKQLFGWNHQIPFTSDVEIAEPDLKDQVRSLASLKKVKVFA